MRERYRLHQISLLIGREVKVPYLRKRSVRLPARWCSTQLNVFVLEWENGVVHPIKKPCLFHSRWKTKNGHSSGSCGKLTLSWHKICLNQTPRNRQPKKRAFSFISRSSACSPTIFRHLFLMTHELWTATRPNKPHEKEHLEHQRLVNQWSAPVNTSSQRRIAYLHVNEKTASNNKSPERYSLERWCCPVLKISFSRKLINSFRILNTVTDSVWKGIPLCHL